ncbi:MAG: alpha/beta fold hydrolase [Dehalococcoidia bacterium]|jgi:phospholipase/carboxylesterase|nr:alpha/beta fold hydrolase [Dehalococcoidia bacterium]
MVHNEDDLALLTHAVYSPKNSSDLNLPTIILLHGYGAHGLDLLPLAPHLCEGKALIICPQAPHTVGVPAGYQAPSNNQMFTWEQRDEHGEKIEGDIEEMVSVLESFIPAALRKYAAKEEKVALVGFSQGGSLAYRLAFSNQITTSAVAALSTWLPDDLDQIDSLPTDLPILVQHGTDDPMVDIERGRESYKRLETRGANVTMKEYSMQHEINQDSISDLSIFLAKYLT